MSRREAWKGAPPESSSAARQHLLAVAQECIERHGFSKVTLSDVATAAGVTRPTVYRHFGSAEELLNAVKNKIHAENAKENLLLYSPNLILDCCLLHELSHIVEKKFPLLGALGR